MFKKFKKASGKEKNAAALPEDGDPGKKGLFARLPRWMWPVLILLGILLVGMVLALLLFSKEKEPEPEPVTEAATPEIPVLIPGLWQLSIMKIPLRVEGETRLPLHLGIAILAKDPAATILLLQNQEAIVTAIRSHIEKGRAEDWEDMAGKLQLKYDLVDLVNGIAGGEPVQGLYITDYMIFWPT